MTAAARSIEDLLENGFEEIFHDETYSDGTPVYVNDGTVRYFRYGNYTKATIDQKYGTYLVESKDGFSISGRVQDLFIKEKGYDFITFQTGYTEITFKLF